MNVKEVSEIRRRCRRDRSNMTAIYGCYVRESKEIISEFKYPISMMPENETEKYMALFKKVLSGTLGKTLKNLSFTTKQVVDKAAEYARLFDLRKCALDDNDKRMSLYQSIIESFDADGNYLILLGCDHYDVPFKSKDDAVQENAGDGETFTYLLCAICPVKETKPNLHYEHEQAAFKDGGMIQAVNAPVTGFLFPAFDDRSTNLYAALFSNKNTADGREKLVEALFGLESPMVADAEKRAFNAILGSSLGEECSAGVIQLMHEQAIQRVRLHKEAKVAEPLMVDRNDVESILAAAGVSCEKVNELGDAFDESFGMDSEVRLENILDTKHLVVKTPNAAIKMDPDSVNSIEVRVIGGQRYLLIPADGDVEINGVLISNPEA